MLVCVLFFLIICRCVWAKIVQFDKAKKVMLEHSQIQKVKQVNVLIDFQVDE
jgi:hypothetical protein